ncbi:hypothetical protein LTS08_007880 [Lithohypha guttulata]|nr:hypothetical protein LTS08_007880 [Lithohypha guttulata]
MSSSWAKVAGTSSNNKDGKQVSAKEVKPKEQQWSQVLVEWYTPRMDDRVKQMAAEMTFARKGLLARLRSDIHDTTRVTDPRTKKVTYPQDPDGPHFTIEIKNRSNRWDTYHLYVKKVKDKNGKEDWIKNSDVRPKNPKKWDGASSWVEDNNKTCFGSEERKVY